MTEPDGIGGVNSRLDEALYLCEGTRDVSRQGINGCETANAALGEFLMRITELELSLIDPNEARSEISAASSGALTIGQTVREDLEQVTATSVRAENVLQPSRELERMGNDIFDAVRHDSTDQVAEVHAAIAALKNKVLDFVVLNNLRRQQFEDYGCQGEVVNKAIQDYRAGN